LAWPIRNNGAKEGDTALEASEASLKEYEKAHDVGMFTLKGKQLKPENRFRLMKLLGHNDHRRKMQ
jgi:hypothetical protein